MSIINEYHHFSLIENYDLPNKFWDVRFILINGCPQRAFDVLSFLGLNCFNKPFLAQQEIIKLTDDPSRYVLYKMGPVLSANHGIGSPSISVVLHELFLMCRKAQVLGCITVLRFDTCGGIGVKPGTVCISDRTLDPLFQDFHEFKICNKLVQRPCVMHEPTIESLKNVSRSRPESLGEYHVKVGATISADGFYEEQARMNGAICEHTQDERDAFMKKARKLGVINIDMEAHLLASMCHKLEVPFGVFCVALVDCLEDDCVKLTKEQTKLFERRLFWICSRFIRHQLMPLIY